MTRTAAFWPLWRREASVQETPSCPHEWLRPRGAHPCSQPTITTNRVLQVLCKLNDTPVRLQCCVMPGAQRLWFAWPCLRMRMAGRLRSPRGQVPSALIIVSSEQLSLCGVRELHCNALHMPMVDLSACAPACILVAWWVQWVELFVGACAEWQHWSELTYRLCASPKAPFPCLYWLMLHMLSPTCQVRRSHNVRCGDQHRAAMTPLA